MDKDEVLTKLKELLGNNDVSNVYCRYLSDGNVIFIHRLVFTWGVHLVRKEHCLHSMCEYRFCFPSLADAIQFYSECQTIYDIPTYGWVAARPEGRILLPKELINYTDKNTFEKVMHLIDGNNPINFLIDEGIYTKSLFHKWLRKNGGKPFDVGVEEFIKNLPN